MGTTKTSEGLAGERRLFSVREYQQMYAAGVLGEDDRVELIEGEVIHMSPIGVKHVRAVNRLTRWFANRLADRATVSVQNPIHLDERNEPQPDLALWRPRPDDYSGGLATPADVLLVVEVADTSSGYDRTVKVPLYGRAGVPETWLVSLAEGWIEVHTEPSPVGYKSVRRVLPGERLSPAAFPEMALEVGEIMG